MHYLEAFTLVQAPCTALVIHIEALAIGETTLYNAQGKACRNQEGEEPQYYEVNFITLDYTQIEALIAALQKRYEFTLVKHTKTTFF